MVVCCILLPGHAAELGQACICRLATYCPVGNVQRDHQAGTQAAHIQTHSSEASVNCAWPMQTQVCPEFIGGLALTRDAQSVVVARGDGDLSLMDLRKTGEQAAVISLGSPLLCCQTDGRAAVVGAQDGQVRQLHHVLPTWQPCVSYVTDLWLGSLGTSCTNPLQSSCSNKDC